MDAGMAIPALRHFFQENVKKEQYLTHFACFAG
jgi:hypothetical protein